MASRSFSDFFKLPSWIGRNANKQVLYTNSVTGANGLLNPVMRWQGNADASWLNLQNNNEIYNALIECPPVSYILYQQALAFINGSAVVTNKKGEDITESFRYNQLLRQPNQFQTDIQFRINIYMMIKAFGFCPVLKIKPAGLKDYGSLFVIPPNFIEFEKASNILHKTSYNDIFTKIYFINGDKKEALNRDQVYIFTDITPYLNDLHLPMSRLVPLAKPITNIIENYKTRGVLLKNRMPLGMIVNKQKDSNGYIPLKPSVKEDVQEAWNQYGLSDGLKSVVITNADLDWLEIGLDYDKLMLTGQLEDDMKTICSGLQYRYNLLAHGSNSTFNNNRMAQIDHYESTIIPEAKNYSQQLCDLLELKSWGENLTYKYDHLSILQEDKSLAAKTENMKAQTTQMLWKMNLLTHNQCLERTNLPTIGPKGEYYYRDTPEGANSQKSKSQSNQTT